MQQLHSADHSLWNKNGAFIAQQIHADYYYYFLNA
jgi:hypothetical protein